MTEPSRQFDVLVIGSGASGLAAAVSAELRGRAGRTRDQGLPSGEQLLQGAGRDPGLVRRRRLAGAARRRCIQVLARHCRAPHSSRRSPGTRSPRSTGSRSSASSSPATRTAAIASPAAAARAPSASSRSATARVMPSPSSCATRGRGRPARSYLNAPLHDLEQSNGHWRARVGEHELETGTVILAAGGRCYAEAERRGELSTNHPNATGEVTQIALGLGAESRDLDALQYHPNGGAWPPNMQGYSIPETTRAYGAVLLNADGEEFTDSLGPRDVVSEAIVAEVGGRPRRRDARRPSGGAISTRRASRSPTRRSRSRTCCAATAAPASTRCVSASSRTPSSTTRTAVLRSTRARRRRSTASTRAARSPGGTHGRNRMMGNSLLECVVFGRRAGKAASEKARS